MRILITNTGPWGTGSGTVADGVMNELRRRGYEVLAFFPDSGFPSAEYDKYYNKKSHYKIAKFPVNYKGTNLYTFPLIIPDPNPRNYADAWTFKDMSQRELAAYFGYMSEKLLVILEEFCPDVIECQHIWAIDYLLKELGYEYICVAHHSDQLGYKYDKRMAEYAKKSAHDAQYIFAISDYVRQEVIDMYGVENNKVVNVKNGYDQSVFHPFNVNYSKVLAEFGLSEYEGLPIITFCGKVSATKGIDVLLKANHIIQAKTKTLILVLGRGELTTFSEEEQKKFHMENVVLLGHRTPDELAKLHNIASLSVLPSRNEGFGIAALEAMGCGIPLVATRTGGLPSFAVGELVEPGNHIQLANSILKILNLSEKEYDKLSNQAYHVAQSYSWSNIVNKRMPYYLKVAELNRSKMGAIG